MRPVVCLLAMSAAVAVAVPAHAAPASREVRAEYAGGGVESVAYFEVTGQGSQTGSVQVATRRTERHVTAALSDDSGRPVRAAVVQRLGADSRSDVELGQLCSDRPGRFALAAPGRPVIVYPLAGRCPSGPSVPTRGRVVLTFATS